MQMLSGLEENPVQGSRLETEMLADAVLIILRSSYKLFSLGGIVSWVEALWTAGIRNTAISSFLDQVHIHY